MSVRDIIILGCSSQQPTRFRNHGAYLVRWNDEGLLFDPGRGRKGSLSMLTSRRRLSPAFLSAISTAIIALDSVPCSCV